MTDKESKSNKGMFDAVVTNNKQVGDRFCRIWLEFRGAGAAAFAEARAGQFAELNLIDTAVPLKETIPEHLRDVSGRQILLRRPFSFYDVKANEEKTDVEILYSVAGPASLRMTTLSRGDTISVIGPLGNGFWVPEGTKKAILVVGGMGAPPILHMAKVLTTDYAAVDVIAFAGAKTFDELPFERRLDKLSQELGFSLGEFGKYGINSIVATDDGTAGYHGLVTDCLAEWLRENDVGGQGTIIYSCGPEAMLAKVVETAKEKNIDCQVSMERLMGCGIGVCQSCIVECKSSGSNGTISKLCCKDGPVFDGMEVVFRV